MKVGMLVPRQPAVALGLVGLEVVENDMDLLVGVVNHDRLHEGEERDPPAPFGMPGLDLAGPDVERGEQGAVAAPPVFVRLAVARAAIGQLEVVLRPRGAAGRRAGLRRGPGPGGPRRVCPKRSPAPPMTQ